MAYKNGENEKLIGEFVRKHNVRDKLFGEHISFELAMGIGWRKQITNL